VKEIAARGATHVFECGPGKILAPLSKRIADGLQGLALADRASLESAAQLSKGA
jgi:[acyl-carrier-protein] S-malonyltransferase